MGAITGATEARYGPHASGNAALQSVAALSSTDQWAVGSWLHFPDAYVFQTLVEHWDGSPAGWAIVPSPNTSVLNSYLYGVAADAPDDVWAVGGTDPVRLPVPQSHRALGRDVMVGRGPGFVPRRAVRRGCARWTIVPSPDPGGASQDNDLWGVAAVTTGDIWRWAVLALS